MNARLSFFTEDLSYRLANKKIIRQWILKVIRLEGFIPGNINFIFCSDQYLLSLNLKYLQHDTFTDVITFDYSEGTGKKRNIHGDIYMSIERIRENAHIYKVSLSGEIRRVMVHGVLHLLGYNDQNPHLRQQMKEKEDFYLLLLPL